MEQNNTSVFEGQNRSRKVFLVLYIVLFYAAWAFKEAFLTKLITGNGSINPNVLYLIAGGIKILLWVVPVFIFLRYIDRQSPLSYLKLNKKVLKGLFWGLFICSAYIAVSLVRGYVTGGLNVNLSLTLDEWLNTIILAGFTEEIVFRGFILQKIEEFLDFKWANVITSVLFIFIHFPRWYFSEGKILFSSILSVFVLGIAFGYTFRKTGSIWSSMIFHAANNFIVLAILS